MCHSLALYPQYQEEYFAHIVGAPYLLTEWIEKFSFWVWKEDSGNLKNFWPAKWKYIPILFVANVLIIYIRLELEFWLPIDADWT